MRRHRGAEDGDQRDGADRLQSLRAGRLGQPLQPSFVTSSSRASNEIWPDVARLRHEVADRIENLPEEQWAANSWCSGWRVRDVLGHLVHLAEATRWSVVGDALRNGVPRGHHVETGAQAQDDVGVLEREVGTARRQRPGPAGEQRMVVADHALGGPRRQHRDPQPLDQGGRFRAGAFERDLDTAPADNVIRAGGGPCPAPHGQPPPGSSVALRARSRQHPGLGAFQTASVMTATLSSRRLPRDQSVGGLGASGAASRTQQRSSAGSR